MHPHRFTWIKHCMRADCMIIALLSVGLPCPKTSLTTRERLCLFLAEDAGCCSGEGGREQHVDRACPNVPWQGLSPVQWWAASSGIPSPSALPAHVSLFAVPCVHSPSCVGCYQIFTCVGRHQMHMLATWQTVPHVLAKRSFWKGCRNVRRSSACDGVC